MSKLFRSGVFVVLMGLSASFAYGQFYTGSYQEFGKNRVQYKGAQWQFHNYRQFKTYFYAGGKNLAVFAARSAHVHLERLQKLFDYYVDEKIDILVFNRQSDFKMSNIGITNDEQSNIGGVTQIVGSKLFVYYEGDHRKLDQQVKAGIAQILVHKMMYGDNWKDAIKNSTLLSLPSWYVDGFISYIGKGWDTYIDNIVKDGVLTNRYTQFNKLEGMDARYAGHSLWNYVAERYGEKVIPQIFYMARVSRNVESGFLFVLGINLNTLANEYINHYRKRYAADNNKQQFINLDELPIRNKSEAVYTQYKINPSGTHAAYVSNQLGQYKIWIYEIGTGKVTRILKRDYKIDRATDYSFPVINWHPKYNALAYFDEFRGNLNLNIYTLDDKRTTRTPILQMDKVLDFAYNAEGTSIVFSGVNQGVTDIYTYKVAGRAKTRITNDLHDDLHPRFIDGDQKIIFSSNRVSDTMSSKWGIEDIKPSKEDFDIFIYDFKGKRKRQVLQRITDTPEADEFHPAQYDKGNYTFVSDRNGIFNRYIAKYDSAIAYIDTTIHYRYFSKEYPLTNYQNNVLHYDMHAKSGRISFMSYQNGKYHFHQGDRSADALLQESDLGTSAYKASLIPNFNVSTTKTGNGGETIKIANDTNDPEIDIDHYTFDGDKPEFEEEVSRMDKENNAKKEEDKIHEEKVQEEEPEFKLPRTELYKTNFATDYIVSQLDNQFLFQSYQRYAGAGAIYFNPGFNGLIKLGISDLFENHKLVGGFRLPANFESGEYLVTYDNLAGRLDHKFVFYRNSFLAVDEATSLIKVITHEVKHRLNFPIDEVQSLRLTTSYRNDNNITQAIGPNSLEAPNVHFHLGSLKLEYVFDAVRPRGLNLYNGTRFKLFAEMYQEMGADSSFFGDHTLIVGGDFRFYQKIHKDIIYAGRLAGSYSFGPKKLVYYMGGVDSWIFRPDPNFNASVQVPQNENFAFQTIATPMRGFIQNIRNGTNFAVINNEVRIPVVKYFAQKPLKSDFLENFQLIGFSDIGAAWTGAHPYSNDNAFNTIVIDQGIYHIELENQKNPIVYGYGFGLRSRLFGYFIRFDWAWGVDDGTRQESIRYLSLSLDF